MTSHVPSAAQDKKLEIAIGWMLRAGVLTAALVVFIGGVLYLRHPLVKVPDYHTFHATVAQDRSARGVIEGVLQGKELAIIQFGMLLLIATPVGRVVFAIVGFGAERDWLYTVVSLIVLAVLIFSLFRGAA
jgi:uncharacterized membrane protein